MDKASLAILGAITVVVAGGVGLSASLDRKPKATEAVASAIKAEMAWFIEAAADPVARNSGKVETATLCLATNEPLDFAVLAERFAGTYLRPIPVTDCRSKTVEGDFGMFAAMTTWSDERGAQSAMLEVESVQCSAARRCVVEIDALGGGNSHEVMRSGKEWLVKKTWMRWVV